MGEFEWISRQSIKPTEKVVYESALDAMIDNGVQVYFVDKETFEKIKESEDHGVGIIKTLESENQKRGVNIISLEDDDK